MTRKYIDSSDPVILWFRVDLRLHDHPGVTEALALDRPIIPVYIWDEALSKRPLGAASKWWLHHSLNVLSEELNSRSSRLIIKSGDSRLELLKIISETKAKTIICSNTFEPKTEKIDDILTQELKDQHVDLRRLNASLLAHPGAVKTKSGGPFKVFTPFYRTLVDEGFCRPHSPEGLSPGDWPSPETWPESLPLQSLGLDNTHTISGADWSSGFNRFTPGERGARKALRRFLRERLEGYSNSRDRPDKDATSYLSPHLRFGEISPQRILFQLEQVVCEDRNLAAHADKFRSELAWRDFSYQLLDQQPELHTLNYRREFDTFQWRHDTAAFDSWRLGKTGYDLVDAGMRELWETGYMHNRVRMVCASFLIKHLLIDWRQGEQWFWDCLLDADPANNPASWQWVAGSGADAAPYFRIFNPLSQAEKFDPAGLYRRRYNPAPTLRPIVEHSFARERALETYKDTRQVEEYHP